MAAVKVTIIGAGSAFTFSVVADMSLNPAFAGSTVALVDTDVATLDLSQRICSRMIAESGADLRLEGSADRRQVLPGSDYVLNSISVGEPWARERDVAIGERHGIFQPTSQTVGPAGVFRGLRVIPQAVAIAQDVARLCPEATILNLANPMAAVCRAMIRETGVRVIGLCEAWRESIGLMAAALDVPERELDLVSVGTNHLGWATALIRSGQDVLPAALERLHSPEKRALLDSVPIAREIYAAFGLWPTGSQDHIAEFFPYFLTPESHGGADYGLITRHTSEAQWQERLRERQALAHGDLPVTGLLRPSGESAVEVLAALAGIGAPGQHMVNIPNQGLIPNLPAAAIVELPAAVDRCGVHGKQVAPLPQPVAHLLHTRAVQQELMVDAALSGDRQRALHCLLLDAQVVSLDTAWRILEESLAANAAWLPNFRR